MRVVIADDSMLLREGLARLLFDAGITVDGTAVHIPPDQPDRPELGQVVTGRMRTEGIRPGDQCRPKPLRGTFVIEPLDVTGRLGTVVGHGRMQCSGGQPDRFAVLYRVGRPNRQPRPSHDAPAQAVACSSGSTPLSSMTQTLSGSGSHTVPGRPHNPACGCSSSTTPAA